MHEGPNLPPNSIAPTSFLLRAPARFIPFCRQPHRRLKLCGGLATTSRPSTRWLVGHTLRRHAQAQQTRGLQQS